MIVHCHNLVHEDHGVMSQELVVNQPCQCGFDYANGYAWLGSVMAKNAYAGGFFVFAGTVVSILKSGSFPTYQISSCFSELSTLKVASK